MQMPDLLDSALFVRKRWCDLIMSGRKTWEIRGQTCRKRGRVCIIECGSGMIIGETTITESRDITNLELGDHVDKHQVVDLSFVKYNRAHAWVLQGSLKYITPIAVPPKRGAIIWQLLPTHIQIQAVLAAQAARSHLVVSASEREDPHVGCQWVLLAICVHCELLCVSCCRGSNVVLAVSSVVS